MKWALRLLIVAVVLIVLVLFAVQAVLWSDFPRRLVADQLAGQTGMNVEIGSLRTGWFGETTVEGFELRLPLEDDPFLVAPTARVRHTGLVPLVLGRPIEIRALEARNARVRIIEDETGEWNIQRAGELLAMSQGPGDAGGGIPAFPELRLTDATLSLERYGHAPVELPATIAGSGTQNDYRLSVESPDRLAVVGRVAATATLPHEIEFAVQNIDDLVALWVADAPVTDLAARGTWRGRIGQNGLTGLLTLAEAATDRGRASGQFEVAAGEQTRVTIRSATVAAPELGDEPLQVDGGELALNGAVLTVSDLRASWMDHSTRVSSEVDLTARTATARIGWRGRIATQELSHGGRLTANVQFPQEGRQRVELDISAGGRVGPNSWQVGLDVNGVGTDWTRMDVGLRAETLQWLDATGLIDLAGLELRTLFTQDQARVTLTRLPYVDTASVRANFEFDTGRWTAVAAIENLVPPRGGIEVSSLSFDAAGDLEEILFSNLRLRTDQFAFDAGGSYRFDRDAPLAAEAHLVAFTGHTDAPADAAFAMGDLRLSGAVQGTVYPLLIQIAGSAAVDSLRLPGGEADPILVPWSGFVDPDGLRLSTETFTIIDGRWYAEAFLDARAFDLDAVLRLDDARLGEIVRAIGVPVEVAGALQSNIEVQLPGLDFDRVEIGGGWSVTDLTGPRFAAERGAGRFRRVGREIQIEDILLHQGDGTIEGVLSFNVDQRERLRLQIASTAWPVAVEGTDITSLLNIRSDVSVDVFQSAAFGTLFADGDVLIAGERYGVVRVDTRLDGRTAELRDFRADLAHGSIAGVARYPIDEPLNALADFVWTDLNIADLAAPWVLAELGITGTTSGRVRAARTEERRALEPFRVDVDIQTAEASVRGVTVGPAQFTAYIGPERAVLDRADMNIAGGTLNAWVRTSRHGDEPFAHVRAQMQGLSIDQLARAADPNAETIPGIISGDIAFGGYPYPPHRLFGQGVMEIDQSDLGNVRFLSALYNLMRIGGDSREPEGRGRALIALEGNALEVRQLQYFNRGVDVVANLRVENIWMGADSPVQGIAAGSARPLRDTNLPFGRDADSLIAALQADAATVLITGTVGEVDARPVVFRDITGALRGLLGGQ